MGLRKVSPPREKGQLNPKEERGPLGKNHVIQDGAKGGQNEA